MTPTPTPLASKALAAARELDKLDWITGADCGPEDIEEVAAIIQKHFQPLLAKVEAENTELKACLEKADRDEDKAITERDAAEDVADSLTSAILGEDIDWSDHGAKWQEAIESVPELTALRADLAAAKERADYWKKTHQRERDQRQLEIGMQEYRGNTVSYIYDKERNYGKHFDRMNTELTQLRADLAAKEAENTRLRNALKVAEMPLQISLDEEEWKQTHLPEGAFCPDDRPVRKHALDSVRSALASRADKGGAR